MAAKALTQLGKMPGSGAWIFADLYYMWKVGNFIIMPDPHFKGRPRGRGRKRQGSQGKGRKGWRGRRMGNRPPTVFGLKVSVICTYVNSKYIIINRWAWFIIGVKYCSDSRTIRHGAPTSIS